MHRPAPVNDGLEIQIIGPLPLKAGEPKTLFWMAKAGQMVLGSVRLHLDHQVAQIRDLQLNCENPRTRQAHSGKLMSAVADFARDHGVLKLKVHRNSQLEWLPQQLSRLGFSDAARNGSDEMQFYLDLYHKPAKKRPHPHRVETVYSLAC